jgi:hypothetical protein
VNQLLDALFEEASTPTNKKHTMKSLVLTTT